MPRFDCHCLDAHLRLAQTFNIAQLLNFSFSNCSGCGKPYVTLGHTFKVLGTKFSFLYMVLSKEREVFNVSPDLEPSTSSMDSLSHRGS